MRFRQGGGTKNQLVLVRFEIADETNKMIESAYLEYSIEFDFV